MVQKYTTAGKELLFCFLLQPKDMNQSTGCPYLSALSSLQVLLRVPVLGLMQHLDFQRFAGLERVTDQGQRKLLVCADKQAWRLKHCCRSELTVLECGVNRRVRLHGAERDVGLLRSGGEVH